MIYWLKKNAIINSNAPEKAANKYVQKLVDLIKKAKSKVFIQKG
jgi:hypothetical protein